VPILLGRLSGIDDSLFIETSLEPQLFNSFNEWYRNRVSIFGKCNIDKILVSEFNVDTLSVGNEIAGFFGKKGFYSVSQKKWFSEEMGENVLSGDFGLLFSTPDFSTNPNLNSFSETFLINLSKSINGKPVHSISVSDGGVFFKTNQNAIFQNSIRNVESVILDGAHIEISPSENVWDIDEINSIVKSSSSGGLIVFSGTDSQYIAQNPDFISASNNPREIQTLDAHSATPSEIERANRKLSARNSVVIVLSRSKNFVDLYEELKAMFGIDKVLQHFSHYEIKVSIDKLCSQCKEDVVDDAGVSRISVGFNLMPGEYASPGNGCSNCVGGYEGTVVLFEKMKSSELTADAIVNYEKERAKEFISPSVLIEKNKDVRNVYKELNTHISHKEVSVKDGIKAVL
jgi:hypothetical protein